VRYINSEPEFYIPSEYSVNLPRNVKQGSSDESVMPNTIHYRLGNH